MRITRGVSGTNASPTWTVPIRSSGGCGWPLQLLNLPMWFWEAGNTGSGNWQIQMQSQPRSMSLLMTRLAHFVPDNALSLSKPPLAHFATFENKSAAREAMCATFITHQGNANQIHNEIPLHTMRMAIIKRCESVGEDVETLEPLCNVGRNGKWCSHYGKQYGGTSKN